MNSCQPSNSTNNVSQLKCFWVQGRWKSITALALLTLGVFASGGICLAFGINTIASYTLLGVGGTGFVALVIASVISLAQNRRDQKISMEHIRRLEKACQSLKIEKNKDRLIKMEDEFWDVFFNRSERGTRLHNLFEMIMLHGEGEVRDKIKLIVLNYNQLIGNELSSEEASYLEKQFCLQFTFTPAKALKEYPSSRQAHPNAVKFIQLPDNKMLLVLDTIGDGSCGFHALLGEPNRQGQYASDAKKYRKTLCDWIRNHPQEISPVLDDFFDHWDHVPSELRTRANNQLRGSLFEERKNLSSEGERESVRQRFKGAILDPYLKYLEKTGSYLLLDELVVAASCFNKTLVLIQPGWGDDHQVRFMTFNEGASDPVCIWYNGYNHFERASIV